MTTFLGRTWGWRDRIVVGAALLVMATLAATLTATVIDSITSRHRTESILLDQRAAASRRVDLLQARIEDLQTQVTAQAVEVGEARQQIADLERQIRRLGGQPITKEIR